MSAMSRTTVLGPPAARLLRLGAVSGLAPRQCLARAAGVQFVRSMASMPSKRMLTREIERQARQGAKKTDIETMSSIWKKTNEDYFKSGGGPLFPGTFVPLPFSQYPSKPHDALLYQWYRMYQWGIERINMIQFMIGTMKGWKLPRWAPGHRLLAITAKEMHADLMNGFAGGHTAVIKHFCTGNFAKKLLAAVERRSSTERTKFEMLSYNSRIFYPRVVAHQIHNVNPNRDDWYTEQAVVAIKSTQKVSKHRSATGELIPKTEKSQTKVEYVVVTRMVHNTATDAGMWQIWGTVPATTLESWQKDQQWVNQEQAKQAGWPKNRQ